MDRCKLLREAAISTAWRRLPSPGGRLIHAMICLDFGKSNYPTENVAHFLCLLSCDRMEQIYLLSPFVPVPFETHLWTPGGPRTHTILAHMASLWWSWAANFLMLDCYLPFQQARSFSRFPGKIMVVTVLERGDVFLFAGPDLSITLSSV